MSTPRKDLPPALGAAPGDDCRCLCGSLLARVVEGGVELRCRRCKRTLIIPVEPGVVRIPAPERPTETIPARRTG